LYYLFLLKYYVGNDVKTTVKVHSTGNVIYIVLAGIMLALDVLSYPSCVILYPFFVYILFRFSGKKKWRDIGIFTLTCGLCGMAYLTYLLSYQTVEGLLNTFSYVVSGDITHSIEAGSKMLSLLKYSVYLALLCLLCYGIATFTQKLFRKKGKEVCHVTVMLLAALGIQLVYWIILNDGYETMQLHLLMFALVGLEAYRKIKEEQRNHLSSLLFLGIIGSGISLIAVIYLTDLTLVESLPHAMLASFFGAVLFILHLQTNQESICQESKKDTVLLVLLCWALVAIFGKGYTLRSGTGYNNVLQSGGFLREGPAGCTISNYMGAYIYNSDYEAWQKYIQDDDKVLIMVDQVMNLGTIQYLFQDVELSHYSIVNPTAYDERLLEYWEMFPEKEPNVIIVDCWYGQLMTDENGWLMKYIESDFGYTQVIEDKYIRIYRK